MKKLLLLALLTSGLVQASGFFGKGGGGSVPGPMVGGIDCSVLFIHPDNMLDQDNSNFCWDVNTHRLGVGINTPDADLHIFDTDGGALLVGSSSTFINNVSHMSEFIAPDGSSIAPIAMIGGTGNLEIAKDSVYSKAVSYGMAIPGNPPGDDMVFSTYDGATWSERQRISSTDGNVSFSSSMLVPGSVAIGPDSSLPTTDLVEIVQNQNNNTRFSVKNSDNGSDAASFGAFYNDTGGSAVVGVTGSGYTHLPILANRAVIDSAPSLDGIVLNNEGSTPIVFGINSAEVARFDSSGLLGIGTDTPNARVFISANEERLFEIHNTGSGGSGADFATFRFSNPDRIWQFSLGAAGSPEWAGKWYVYDETAGFSRLLIDTDGHVGVGTNFPTTTLDVVGDIQSSNSFLVGPTALENNNTYPSGSFVEGQHRAADIPVGGMNVLAMSSQDSNGTNGTPPYGIVFGMYGAVDTSGPVVPYLVTTQFGVGGLGLAIQSDYIGNPSGVTMFGTHQDDGSGAIVQVNGDINIAGSYKGDGSGLSNVPVTMGVPVVNGDPGDILFVNSGGSLGQLDSFNFDALTGTLNAPFFVGDGSGLTNTTAAQVVNGSGNFFWDGTKWNVQGVIGSATATWQIDDVTGVFSGDGSGLTGVTSTPGALTSAHLFVGNASNVATDTAITGDVTLSNTGVTAIGSGKVTNTMLAGSINASTKLTNTVPLANGGTNAAITAAAGALVYSTSSALGVTAAGTSGQIIQSAGTGTPVWSTATYPGTAGATGNVLVSSGTNWSSGAVNLGGAGVTGTLLATKGGTSLSTYATGDTLYSNGTNSLAALAGNTTTTRKFLSQAGNGTISAAPTWNQPSLTTDVTGTLQAANMGALTGDITSAGGVFTTTLSATTNATLASLTNPAGVAIHGTITSAAAAAGNIGEVIEATAGSTNFPTSTQFGDLVSISLTAGSWEINSFIVTDKNGATVTDYEFGVSTTANNSSTGLTLGTNYGYENPGSVSDGGSMSIPGYIVRPSTTTIYYLKYKAAYSIATPHCYGRITAKRIN